MSRVCSKVLGRRGLSRYLQRLRPFGQPFQELEPFLTKARHAHGHVLEMPPGPTEVVTLRLCQLCVMPWLATRLRMRSATMAAPEAFVSGKMMANSSELKRDGMSTSRMAPLEYAANHSEHRIGCQGSVRPGDVFESVD